MEDGLEKQEASEEVGEVDTLFDLDEDIFDIPLQVKRKGRVYTLKHRLRAPSARQWKDFQRNVSRRKKDRSDNSPEPRMLEASEKLWGEIAVSVEGYGLGGKKLDCSGEDWKKRIDILHKFQAVQELGNVWVADEDDIKNSESASDE